MRSPSQAPWDEKNTYPESDTRRTPSPAPLPLPDNTDLLDSALPRGILVVEQSTDAALIGTVHRLRRLPFTLGRGACELQFVEARGVSRLHAQITFRDGVFFIEDLGSLNHTFVNEVELPVNVPTPLHYGARIRLGAFTVLSFVYRR